MGVGGGGQVLQGVQPVEESGSQWWRQQHTSYHHHHQPHHHHHHHHPGNYYTSQSHIHNNPVSTMKQSYMQVRLFKLIYSLSRLFVSNSNFPVQIHKLNVSNKECYSAIKHWNIQLNFFTLKKRTTFFSISSSHGDFMTMRPKSTKNCQENWYSGTTEFLKKNFENMLIEHWSKHIFEPWKQN